MIYQRTNNKEDRLCFLFAAIATIVVFSVFVAQGLFSDVVTFAKSGDADKFTFAAFMKIRECIVNGENFVGVDSGSFNGATEFFLRPNFPGTYIWIYIFAALSVVFPPRAMFLLLYVCHMFVGLYLIQKLCKKYFGLDNKISIIVASMFLYLLCIEAWYLSFFIITTLSVVLLYFSLECFYSYSPKTFLKLMFTVIMAVTSGYISVSCFLVAGIYIFSLIYVCAEKKDRSIRHIIKYTIPYFCAGVVSLPYLLQVCLYVKGVVKSSMTLWDATSYKLNLNDLYSVVSGFSFTSSSSLEGVAALSLGLIACIVLGYAVVDGVMNKLCHRNRIIVIFNLVVWFVMIIWSTESSTALTGWMYSFIPVLGGMHIPNRYMMVTYPFLYISIGILFQKVEWKKYSKSLKNIAVILGVILAVYLLIVKIGIIVPFVVEDHFVIEGIITIAFLMVLGKNDDQFCNERKIWLTALWCFSLVIQGTTHLYNAEGLFKTATSVENSSIIYNEAAIQTIDEYISATGDVGKKEYRFVAYDSIDSVPVYLLGNYEWYSYSQYSLCNYSGYELHLCTPLDYREKSPWFNVFDWEYLANTRADYIMIDYATVDANRTFFDSIIDWDKGVADIGNGRIMVSLYHFIPSTICGTPYVYEDKNSLDNGFFYSHDLNNGNIVSFDTDENSYYEMTIDSDKSSVIAFLPYANRYYHYYIDGIEQQSEIVNMQAIIRLDSGKHTIRVVYENWMGKLGFYFILITDIVLILIIIFLEIKHYYHNHNRI